MKDMPQLLPPVCMCPLSESNQYLSKKHILDFKKCLGNQGAARSFCISFFLSLVTCPKPQTDSPRKQKLGDNLGKGSKSRAQAPPVWVTCLSPSLPLWFCCIRAKAPGEKRCVTGTSGELDHRRANVLRGLRKGAVTAVWTKSSGVFYCFLQSHVHAKNLQPTVFEMHRSLSAKLSYLKEKE